ncbi:glycosyltransferase [candidate division KSB1 bacterium]|nr:glycosyltransferase [candidate division KSB1 bacterium]
MRFVFYCSKFPPQPGGAGIDAYYLGRDLSEDGHEVHVVCEHAPGLKKFEKLNDRYSIYRVAVPLIKNRGSGAYFLSLCAGIARRGIRVINKENIDIVHCHDTATGIAGLITKFITRKPTVFKFGGSMTYEYLCNSNMNGWDPAVGESWAWENSTGMAKSVLGIEKQFFIRFDKIYPIAQYLVDILKKHLDLPNGKVKLIHNGIDTKSIRKENFKNIKNDLKINKMIFTGVRFVKYKGVHVLIEACKPILQKLNAHLVIAGDGPERATLKKMAAGCENIIFSGNLSWEDNMNYVRSADVFVLPTLVDKTPSSLMEALAMETPCITSEIDGVRELIAPGCGITVEPNNSDALADKICWVLEHPDEAKKMGKRGREFIINEFRWDLTADKIKELYAELSHETGK